MDGHAQQMQLVGKKLINAGINQQLVIQPLNPASDALKCAVENEMMDTSASPLASPELFSAGSRWPPPRLLAGQQREEAVTNASASDCNGPFI